MIGITLNRAEIEYAVMLAVLNFETEFMKSHYTQATVHIHDTLIEVTLKAATSIPAEDRGVVTEMIRVQMESLHPGRAAPLGVTSGNIEAYLARTAQHGAERAARQMRAGAVVRAVAERLRAFASSDVHLARLAGDEFAVLATGRAARDRHTLAVLASDIVEAIASPFAIDSMRLSIGVSIGIAVAPQNGSLEILRRADLALYRTKSDGRGGYCFYEAEMDERIEARRALSTDLRGALDRNEFLLHFQQFQHHHRHRGRLHGRAVREQSGRNSAPRHDGNGGHRDAGIA